MFTIKARNVNLALVKGVRLLQEVGIPRPSRNGPTLEVPFPVTTTYILPQERVLRVSGRGDNPFFHFFEALWMLAGREDVDFVARFVKRMLTFSDDSIKLNGAYGYRWRFYFGMNQLESIATLLRKEPDSRRAVLTMWDPTRDLGVGGRDLPCNTQVYFKVRAGVLHQTVCNRSNDIIWGAYGANAVHLSMLHEYMANKVGVGIGPYHQISDSFHAYTSGPGGEVWKRVCQTVNAGQVTDPYAGPDSVMPYPLGAQHDDWDADLLDFFERWDRNDPPLEGGFRTPFWTSVVAPMWMAWRFRDPDMLKHCHAEDWKRAALKWLADDEYRRRTA